MNNRLKVGLNPSFYNRKVRYIGILGGAFNPAHQGHIDISCLAKKLLDLDEVWWLVHHNHPIKHHLKSVSLAQRIAQAENITSKIPFIRVTALESFFGTSYSVDTIKRLFYRYKSYKFTWIMGTDNLKALHKWYKWRGFCQSVHMLSVVRGHDVHRSIVARAPKTYKRRRLSGGHLRTLARCKKSSWAIAWARRNPLSSTGLRSQ